MTQLDFSALKSAPRLLFEASLKPAQGERFQPTGFADLGAAHYTLADGTEMLLVESAQSVANRLEATVWDSARGDLIGALKGLPYVNVTVNSKSGSLGTTSTLQEAHRLNSAYIWSTTADANMESFRQQLREGFGVKSKKEKSESDESAGILDMPRIARTIFKYDPNTVLHGAFLEKVGDGRVRLARAITGFIEARNVRQAESGGVKNDRVDPSGDSAQGFANIPFHRTEFTAQTITAYFNLDLALLRGYGLDEAATNLLIALALLKARLFLESGLRLRTACDFDVVGEVRVTRPTGFALPAAETLLAAMPGYVSACRGLFADPAITNLSGTYAKTKKDKKGAAAEAETDDEAETEA
jgi:CRISPR-associated protein Csb1